MFLHKIKIYYEKKACTLNTDHVKTGFKILTTTFMKTTFLLRNGHKKQIQILIAVWCYNPLQKPVSFLCKKKEHRITCAVKGLYF